VRDGERPVAALQVRSRLEDDGTQKKVRATLRGITARRLTAHRRLMAAISELERSSVFSDPVGSAGEVLIVSTANGDKGADPGDSTAPRR
jgi:hypothetical protein